MSTKNTRFGSAVFEMAFIIFRRQVKLNSDIATGLTHLLQICEKKLL